MQYAASVDFGSGIWRPVAGYVTATTGGYDVRVVEVRTALVDQTCLENPRGPAADPAGPRHRRRRRLGMTRVYADLAISADGFSTGPNQREDVAVRRHRARGIHEWMFEHADDHRAELDAILAARAYIMGRNMFGPVRGEWTRRLAGLVGT